MHSLLGSSSSITQRDYIIYNILNRKINIPSPLTIPELFNKIHTRPGLTRIVYILAGTSLSLKFSIAPIGSLPPLTLTFID
jgi:hypothetical protein